MIDIGETNPIDPHRLRDVLDLLLAKILKAQIHLAFHMIDDGAGHTDAARFGQSFQARCDVDAVTVDIVTLDDNVADVDSDAVGNSPVFWYINIATGHGALKVNDIPEPVRVYRVCLAVVVLPT